MKTTPALPTLPKSAFYTPGIGGHLFTAEQMREYALATLAQPVQPAVSDDEILSARGDFAIDAIGKPHLIRISRQVLNFAASKASLVSATLTEGS